jgi:molybdopterin-guanine dinucleotide biosynthesis protein B
MFVCDMHGFSSDMGDQKRILEEGSDMRVFNIFGVSLSGKTATVEAVTAELRRRNYTVGTIKDIHFEEFSMDQPGTNTYRHRMAGSQLVTARGLYETDVMFPRRMSLADILKLYDQEFVIMEGAHEFKGPGIISARTEAEIDERRRNNIFAVVGQISNRLTEYKGLPVINALVDTARLVDLIEQTVPLWCGQPEWLEQEDSHAERN